MMRIDPEELSQIILIAPAWCQIGLTMPDENLRIRAASELAITIVERLSDFPVMADHNQLHLPL